MDSSTTISTTASAATTPTLTTTPNKRNWKKIGIGIFAAVIAIAFLYIIIYIIVSASKPSTTSGSAASGSQPVKTNEAPASVKTNEAPASVKTNEAPASVKTNEAPASVKATEAPVVPNATQAPTTTRQPNTTVGVGNPTPTPTATVINSPPTLPPTTLPPTTLPPTTTPVPRLSGESIWTRKIIIKRVSNWNNPINLSGIKVFGLLKEIPLTANQIVLSSTLGDYTPANLLAGRVGFLHTLNDNPSVTIDLGTPTWVSRIEILNRSDCCGDRIIGLQLQVLDDKDTVMYQKDISYDDRPRSVSEPFKYVFNVLKKGMAVKRLGVNEGQVYQYTGTALRWYPNPDIAYSWDLAWPNFAFINATNIPIEQQLAANPTPVLPFYIYLKSGNSGKYCVATESSKMVCNADLIGSTAGFSVGGFGAGASVGTKFAAQPIGTNKIALMSLTSNKFCADEGGQVICNRSDVGPWENFTVELLGNNKLALIGGKTGKYCADDSGIVCNRNALGPWETFTFEAA
jgi:hypothetical protein